MKNFKFLFNLILPYLCVAMILIVGILFTNGILLNKYENSYMETLEKSMTSVSDSIENRIAQAQKMCDAVASNNQILLFSSGIGQYGVNDAVELINVKNAIKSYQFDSDFVRSVFVYNKDREIIIDGFDVYREPYDYYTANDYQNVISYEDWYAYINADKWKREYVNMSEDKTDNSIGLHFIQSIPLDFTRVIKGGIFLSLSSSEIKSYFSKILRLSSGYMFIFDRNGKLLLSTDSSGIIDTDTLYKKLSNENYQRTKQGKFFKISNEYASTGWTYVIMAPESIALEGMKNTKKLVFFADTLLVLLCVSLCVWLGNKKRNAFYSLFDMLKLEESEVDSYIFEHKRSGEINLFKSIVARLIENSEVERNKYEQWRKNGALLSLMIKDYDDINEVLNMLSYENISMNGRAYGVVILRFDKEYRTFNEKNMNAKDFAKSIILSFATYQMEFVDVSAREIAVVFSFDEKENCEKYIAEFVSEAVVEINYPYGLDIMYGAGNCVDNIADISESYFQAKKVIKYSQLHGDRKIFMYKHIPSDEGKRFYPLETELKIYNYTIAGCGEKAIELLMDVYKRNFTENKISLQEAELLFSDIRSTLAQIMHVLHKDTEIFVGFTGTAEEFFKEVCDLLEHITKAISGEKKNRSDRALNDIIVYIDENYSDSQLSLTKLSEKFNVHEHYISTLFKKHTKENFFSYLENKRIDSACKLILENKYTIEEISLMVGYTSDTTFRRAFKKIKGVPPSKYRK